MSGSIFDNVNNVIVEKTKKDKLLMMQAQMGSPIKANWGSDIGVIHLYIPKNMYDVMGSKVIEMSDELKEIGEGKKKTKNYSN